jgi:hypothetical protein
VEGFFGLGENPSTRLRLVPLPDNCRGGILKVDVDVNVN